jgi:hypothetical protein
MTTSASTPWHAAAPLLERFARDPAGVDAATAASLESHLVACDGCRAELARQSDPALAATSWAALVDRIDRPKVSLLERLLQRLGVRSGPARLVAATPGLRLSGLAAVAALTAFATVVAREFDSGAPFLAVAPLVPLAAVALTFAPAVDPAGEAGIGTPVHGAGLAMRRAIAVLAIAFVVLAIGAVAVPDLGAAPLGWVLPAAALAVGSLALGTWIRLEVAVGGLAAAWVGGIGLALFFARSGRSLDGAAPFTVAGQGVALSLTVVAAAVLVARADRYATLEAGR